MLWRVEAQALGTPGDSPRPSIRETSGASPVDPLIPEDPSCFGLADLPALGAQTAPGGRERASNGERSFNVYTLCVCLVTQLCLTLYNPLDYSPSGSSVHGIAQTRTLQCVVISFSNGSNLPLLCLLYCRQILYPLVGVKWMVRRCCINRELSLALCDDLDGWDGEKGQRLRKEGVYV